MKTKSHYTAFSAIVIILLSLLHTNAFCENNLSADNYKYKTTKQVLDNIVRVIGCNTPYLVMLPYGNNYGKVIARFNPKTTILFEESLYDLCTGFGKDSLNAIALIIGHEIVHFSMKHNWLNEFGTFYADLPVGEDINNKNDSAFVVKQRESQADEMGGLYAFIAGYNPLSVGANLISEIYKHYELKDKDLTDAGYPSLSERQEITKRSMDNLRRLIPYFEAGNRLILVEKYEEAARCFELISINFPGCEIYNNLGVAKALAALQMLPDSDMKFAYPFEFDANSRLSAEGTKGIGSTLKVEDKERFDILLKEAESAFIKAKSINPQYPPAIINLACIHELQGKHGTAIDEANEAIGINNISGFDLSNAYIIRGIINFSKSDNNNAIKDFRNAQMFSNRLADYNLWIAEGKNKADFQIVRKSEKLSRNKETICGFSIGDEADIKDYSFIEELPQPGDKQSKVLIKYKESTNCLIIDIVIDNKSYFFISTSADNKNQSGSGIKIEQSDTTDVIKNYGYPFKVIPSSQYSYWYYDFNKIIFMMKPDGKIAGWMLYSIINN